MLMLVLCGGSELCTRMCVCVLLMQMVYNLAAEVY